MRDESNGAVRRNGSMPRHVGDSLHRLAWLAIALACLAIYPASASAETVPFGHTGAEQQFTVPAGVSTIHVVARGGTGGVGHFNPFPFSSAAQASGTITVTPGQKLFIAVGGEGGDATGPPGGAGGWNGGAAGGSSGAAGCHGGGGGGGATDIRTVTRSSPGSLESRLIVAAGGGGSGGNSGDNLFTGGPGGGPGLAGGAGSGGAGGYGGQPAATGTDQGEAGGSSAVFVCGGGGGGGAGGFRGGGGAANGSGGDSSGGGGGGGSNYFAEGVGTTAVGLWAGVPSLTITYTPPSGGTPGGSPPVNTERPKITAGPDPGTIACTEGIWTGLPPSPTYVFSWWRQTSSGDWEKVSEGPAARSYKLQADDSGRRFQCLVTVAGASAFSDTAVVGVRADGTVNVNVSYLYGNVRIRGIDVFQAVQPNSRAAMFGYPSGRFENYCGGGTPTAYLGDPPVVPCSIVGASTQTVPYKGVAIDADKPTAALVYVDATRPSGLGAADPSQPLEVTLRIHLPGADITLVQTITDPPAASTPWVTAAERAQQGVRFDLPAVLAGKSVSSFDLSASVRFPLADANGPASPYECGQLPGCGADDNTFQLSQIGPVARLPALRVDYGRMSTTGTGDALMKRAMELFPGGQRMSFPGLARQVDVSAITSLMASSDECKPYASLRDCHIALITQAAENVGVGTRTDYDLRVYAHDYRSANADGTTFIEPGWKSGGSGKLSDGGRYSTAGTRPLLFFNSGSASRPLTATAHELGHAIAAPHAGQDCNLTRKGDAQEGEPWPSDEGNDQGRLQGTTYDAYGTPGDRVVDETATPRFDLMSYCAAESNSWISPFNWNRFFSVLRTYGALAANQPSRAAARAVAGAGPGDRLATGVIGPNGGSIVSVRDLDKGAELPAVGPAGSPYSVRALGGDGAVLAEVPVELITSTEGSRDSGSFSAVVPEAAVAVELVRAGGVLDRIERSAAPKVKLRSPRRGASVKTGGKLVVRWKAQDPDGDTVQARVDFSADGGKSWETAFSGPSTGQVRIPGNELPATDRARVRVVITDGFSEGRAISGTFSTAGRQPQAEILRPLTSESVTAGQRVGLVGTAFDDRGKELNGKRLRWYAGKRLLGRGGEVTAKLPAGKAKLRLVATDSRGRRGVATTTLHVAPVELLLTKLKVPESVRRKARSAKLQVATSGPARLRIGGKTYDVGPKARTLEVALPAKPKTGLLEVPYRVKARGGDTRGSIRSALLIARG